MGSKKKSHKVSTIVATKVAAKVATKRVPSALSPVFFYGSLIIFVVGPFLHGYYWPVQHLAVSLLVLAAGLIMLLAQHRGKVRSLSLTLPQAAAFVLLFIYLLGLILPVSAMFSLQAVLLWAGVILLYFGWTIHPLSERQEQILVDVFVATGGALAAAGLAVYLKVVEHPLWMVGNRLSAGFEYPNVTAGFLLMVLLLAWHSGLWTANSYRRLGYTFAAVLSLTATFFTYSRGGWLVAAATVFLLGLYNLRQKTLQTLVYGVWCLGTGALAIFVAMRWAGLPGFLALLGVALVAGAATTLRPLPLRPRFSRALLGLGLALALAAVGMTVYATFPFLTERLSWAFDRFSLEAMLQDGRLVFFRDGLSVLYQSPVIGHGGGAWRSLYVAVQSYHYGSQRMHSDPLEILLEVGLIGIAAYLILLAVPLYYGLRSRKHLHQGLAFAVVGFIMHSSIDAFLGFPVFYYLVAAFLAVISPRTPLLRFTLPEILAGYKKTLVALVLGVALVGNGLLWLSEAELRWGTTPAVARNDQAAAVNSLRRAVLMNPFELSRRLEYYSVLAQTNATPARLEGFLRQTARFEPHDPRVSNTLGHFFLERRNFALALAYFRRALEQQPMNVQNYEALAFAYLVAATESAAEGRPPAEHLKGVASVHEQLQATIAATPPRLLALSAIPLTTAPFLEVARAGRLVLLGDAHEALALLRPLQHVPDATAREIATAWLARAYQLQGRTSEADALIAAQGTAESFKSYFARVLAATGK